ncbi:MULTISPECIES: hypothetical protein [unclassified Colwellia]|jgi:hypothetical protein|uniref:hypothetical protein n=1 Tax=unclassified Colwellia TaxID=196834 RepID=UPI0015F54660|nr:MULTISPECIES: hypothetical protein [unclassified Colwellia]MBA6337124.1 hypothetical protein [Colwellia sp. BRX8-7]MBA6349221.1 hypothetical protein [Colwellia sp. BRX8-9]MBA6353062.1 hypothetical protein [Colwellia sp. BRX9-1]MBA6356132.1 hypothetical protein [Colwellia sp. BRX8-3]MBA6359181.1 hypothetical protein [Colwellia sp. BRX8-6]|tara:strand:+ start:2042 stop:2746 length:705 start_codon:yes stop_codon:yes gene_type:complete
MKKIFYVLTLLLYNLYSVIAFADGVVVDKVYHPYVLPNEKEVEWRLLSHQTEKTNDLAQRFAYGQSVLDNLMVEFYIVGERDIDGNFGLSAYEIETRWMLTEQGQYWADWGMLFEFEKEHNKDSWEVTSGLLFEKEIGRTSLSINAFLIYEWGNDIKNEIEMEFRAQYRYRWLPQFQPAIELYSGEDYVGIGPAFMGIQRFDRQKQLKWELAFITGLNGESKDHILRAAIEFEF